MVGWSVERHGRSKAEECGAFRERVESFGDGILENGGVRVQGSGGETRPGFPPDMHINTIPAAAANHPVPSPPPLSHWFSRLVIYIYIYTAGARMESYPLNMPGETSISSSGSSDSSGGTSEDTSSYTTCVYFISRRGKRCVWFRGGWRGRGRGTSNDIVHRHFLDSIRKKILPLRLGCIRYQPFERGGGREGRRVHPPRHFYY